MKMRREQGSQLVIPTQVAHDLRDGQCGKGTMGLQAYRQHIGKHLDEQSRVQTMTLSLHRTNMEDGFEHLPETFDQMMLLPNVPDFCPAHRDFAKVHQIIAARGTLLKKEECDGTKSGTVTLDSTSRHVNAPCGIMQNQCFFPRRGVLLFPINGKGVIAFACNDDFGKPSPMKSLSERL